MSFKSLSLLLKHFIQDVARNKSEEKQQTI